MKRFLTVFLVAPIVLSCVLFSGCGDAVSSVVTLNVYNWGEYISDGSEGCLDVNAAFEDYFNEELSGEYGFKIKVNYTTYASNEDMYNKIRSGAASYDVIIPSDYMIQRMIDEELLMKLDFSNIPNFEYIDEEFVNPFYDPKNEYSVPYAYGQIGVIYNSSMVDEEDTGSWELMWNEKYKGKILQFNNPRDAIGTAMYYLGIDVNTTEHSEWDKAAELLKEQKPLVQSYVMDEIFNKMKNGSAAVAAYYAGDYLTMYEDNEYLEFYYPEEGTNVYIDAMCVPACARNKELAELYINFMLSEEPAIANAEYTYYASPNSLVYENEEYQETMSEIHEDAMEIIYPTVAEDYVTSYYQTLDNETLSYENFLWESLKIENSIELWIHIAAGAIVFALVLFFLRRAVIKKHRESQY